MFGALFGRILREEVKSVGTAPFWGYRSQPIVNKLELNG